MTVCINFYSVMKAFMNFSLEMTKLHALWMLNNVFSIRFQYCNLVYFFFGHSISIISVIGTFAPNCIILGGEQLGLLSLPTTSHDVCVYSLI
jgi:hypothetical protein